jgi:hypothetical protein
MLIFREPGMDITSPFVVVPVIAFVFFACILWSTGGTADGHTADDAHHSAH